MNGIRRIGYVSDTYDFFGVSHLAQLRAARAACDFLFVGVLADEVATNAAGKLPVIPFEERLSIVRAMRSVDAAVGQMTGDLFGVWQQLRFDRLFVLAGNTIDGTHERLRTVEVEIIVLSPQQAGPDETGDLLHTCV